MTDPRVQTLIDWIAAREGAAGLEITPDTDLLATGALDSMGLVSLFFLVETLGGRPVDLADAVAQGPITPAAIVQKWM